MITLLTKDDYKRIPTWVSFKKALNKIMDDIRATGDEKKIAWAEKRYLGVKYNEVSLEPPRKMSDGTTKICGILRKKGFARIDVDLQMNTIDEVFEEFEVEVIKLKDKAALAAILGNKLQEESKLYYREDTKRYGLIFNDIDAIINADRSFRGIRFDEIQIGGDGDYENWILATMRISDPVCETLELDIYTKEGYLVWLNEQDIEITMEQSVVEDNNMLTFTAHTDDHLIDRNWNIDIRLALETMLVRPSYEPEHYPNEPDRRVVEKGWLLSYQGHTALYNDVEGAKCTAMILGISTLKEFPVIIDKCPAYVPHHDTPNTWVLPEVGKPGQFAIRILSGDVDKVEIVNPTISVYDGNTGTIADLNASKLKVDNDVIYYTISIDSDNENLKPNGFMNFALRNSETGVLSPNTQHAFTLYPAYVKSNHLQLDTSYQTPRLLVEFSRNMVGGPPSVDHTVWGHEYTLTLSEDDIKNGCTLKLLSLPGLYDKEVVTGDVPPKDNFKVSVKYNVDPGYGVGDSVTEEIEIGMLNGGLVRWK